MEIVIENVSIVGFSKIYNAFQKQMSGYCVDNRSGTVNVFLGDSSFWKIRMFSWGVYLTNEENNATITLASEEFNKIVIQ